MKYQRTISELRESIGLTQKEFASLLGVSDKTLWSLEQDSSNISNNLLSKIMDLFSINYDEIFLGKKYDKIVFERNKVLEKLAKIQGA